MKSLSPGMGQRHHPVGHTRCFINRTLAHAVPPKAVSGSPGIAVSHALWCQCQEAAILPWDTEVPSSWSFALMHSWGIWNWYCGPQTTLLSCEVFYFISSPDMPRPHPTGSYGRPYFAGCMILEPAQGPGLWSPRGPSGQWWLLKARDCGRGSSHSE